MENSCVEITSRPQNKTKDTVFIKTNDQIAQGKLKNVVYSIPCGTADGKVYVGQMETLAGSGIQNRD